MKFCRKVGRSGASCARDIRASPHSTNSLLKKSLPELFQHAKQKARFLLCFIFKHLPCLKMPAHPCAGRSLLKNGVFQQTAKAQREAQLSYGKRRCRGCICAWFATVSLIVGCAGPVGAGEAVLEFRAEVVRIELEGGFWGLVAEDGRKYDPGRLTPDFQQAGLKVRVSANRAPRVSFRMWGTPIDVLQIEPAPNR
jgi:hypothetical protein